MWWLQQNLLSSRFSRGGHWWEGEVNETCFWTLSRFYKELHNRFIIHPLTQTLIHDYLLHVESLTHCSTCICGVSCGYLSQGHFHTWRIWDIYHQPSSRKTTHATHWPQAHHKGCCVVGFPLPSKGGPGRCFSHYKPAISVLLSSTDHPRPAERPAARK